MKKIKKLMLAIFIGSAISASSQQTGNFRTSKEVNSAIVSKLSPAQKMNMLQEFRQDLIIEELAVPESKQAEFSALYNEYQKSQRSIKSNFQKKDNFESLNDAEAIQELESSFELGQKLLDNKKDYSKKFQRVIKPQQVLMLFENEGKMRNKVRERRSEIQETPRAEGNKPSTNSRPAQQQTRPMRSTSTP